jgi:hypothetical protein
MADQYTPEEIAEIFEAYNNAIRTGTPVTQQMADAVVDAQKAFKGYSALQRDSMKMLQKGVVDYTKAMHQGEQGMKAMGGAIDAVTGAVDLLLLLIPGSKLLKVGLMAANHALGMFTKTAGEQSDKLFKSYQDLTQAGAAAAGGMTEIFQNMQKFGYGIEELDKMTAIVKENSAALASFGGTAASGTRAFAEAASEIQRSGVGRDLRMLGKGTDDINRGMAMFIKQQQQSGMTNSQINQNLASRSAEYIKNLDILSKLTGEDASRLQQKLDDAMAEDAFNQTVYELRKKEAAGDVEAGRQANEYENAARRLTGEALKEFQRGVGGDISAMSKTLMTSGEAVMMIGQKSFTASGYIDALAKGAVQTREAFGGLAKFNATRDFILPMSELSQAESRYTEVTAQNQEELAKAQQRLQEKGLDPATKAQVELRIEQMKARDNLQSFTNLGVKPATQALEILAKGATAVTKLAPGEVATGQAIGGGSANFSGALNRFDPRNRVSEANKTLLDIIGQGESRGNYNALVYGRGGANVPKSANLTGMTIAEVMEYQKGMIGQGHASTAVGKYQFIAATLAEQVKKAGLDANKTKFDEKTQDLLAQQLIKQAGVGRVDKDTAMRNLAGIWASLPADMTGRGRYDGYNSNKSTIDPAALSSAIAGPASRYENKMSSVRPDKALPPKETAEAANTQDKVTDSESILSTIARSLQNLDRNTRDTADNTKKSAQYAGG